MTRQKSQDRCVECGAPANRQMVCPVHEPDYSDVLVDDVDPAAREPAPGDDTAICPACDGSGFGVADTYCSFCGGCGGVPIAVADKYYAARKVIAAATGEV